MLRFGEDEREQEHDALQNAGFVLQNGLRNGLRCRIYRGFGGGLHGFGRFGGLDSTEAAASGERLERLLVGAMYWGSKRWSLSRNLGSS